MKGTGAESDGSSSLVYEYGSEVAGSNAPGEASGYAAGDSCDVSAAAE